MNDDYVVEQRNIFRIFCCIRNTFNVFGFVTMSLLAIHKIILVIHLIVFPAIGTEPVVCFPRVRENNCPCRSIFLNEFLKSDLFPVLDHFNPNSSVGSVFDNPKQPPVFGDGQNPSNVILSSKDVRLVPLDDCPATTHTMLPFSSSFSKYNAFFMFFMNLEIVSSFDPVESAIERTVHRPKN